MHTPAHGSVTNDRNPVFRWDFHDPDGGDFQTAWQIQISAGDGGAFTNIVIDSGKNTTVTNQWTFYGLGDNQYYYRIRTWDREDAVSPWSWVPQFGIENTPPTCTGGTPSPRYLKVDPGGSFRVEVTGVSDNWSGVRNVQFATWTEANGQDDIRWYDGVNAGNGIWYFDVPIANHGNAEGKYLCHVYAWDNAGNSGNIRVIDTYVDRTPPNVGSVSGPHYTNQTGGTFRVWAYNVTDSSGISRVQFPTCHTANTNVWKWYNGVRDGGSNNWYCDIPMGEFANAEGTYFSDVYAYDNAGNQAPSVRIVTYVDRTPPTVASVQGLSYTNQTGGTRRVWIYGAADAVSGIAKAEVVYNAAAMTPKGPFPAGQSGNDYFFDVPIYVGDDRYKAEFRLHDRAGNTGYYKVEFIVDSQRPNDPNPSVVYDTTSATFTWLRFSDPNPSSGYARTFLTLGEWTGTDWVDGEPNLAEYYNVTEDFNVLEYRVTELKPGTRYRYTFIHQDKAGNESSFTWRDFVTKKKIGEFQLEVEGATVLTFPIYDPESGVLGSKALRIAIAAGIGCFELFGADVNPFKVQTAKGIMTIQS
nr:GBS Bsp-like repeat-containing protein [Paenibacillus elgii]